MSDAPPAGHNLPDLSAILSPEVISILIGIEIEALRPRADELVASCRRFLDAHPTIDSDEIDATAAQVLATCQRFYMTKTGRVDAARVAFKAPVLAADNAIGSLTKGPFANVVQPVMNVTALITKLSVDYKVKKDTAERARRKAEADRLAAEAEMTARLATSGSGVVSLDDAVAAAQTAEKAQEAADVKPAELTRAHGDALGTSSLRYKRTVTVVEPAKVDRAYCVPDLALLTRAAGKAGTPLPIIAGCSISDVPDLTVRR